MTTRRPAAQCVCTVAMLSLVACGEEPAPTLAEDRAEPLVVYADYDDEGYLPELFGGFTTQTGIRVTVRHAAAETIVNDVIANRGSPPADVLLTPTVFDIWMAADDGALRPLDSTRLPTQIPAALRDPDGLWVAASFHTAVIAYDPKRVGVESLERYESLAEEDFRGQLCLSSSNIPVNRLLIAMLIDDLGVRPAEIVVRGWIANLALPVFDTEEQLIDAIVAGRCALGIVSSKAVTTTAVVEPDTAYADIEGVGIARHARQPDVAMQFIEWFLSTQIQARHQEGAKRFAASPAAWGDHRPDTRLSDRDVGIAAWRGEDAIKLAQRAGYR